MKLTRARRLWLPVVLPVVLALFVTGAIAVGAAAARGGAAHKRRRPKRAPACLP